MSSKSIFDQLLGSLGGAAGQPGAAPRGPGGSASGGLGDLLSQVSGALGGRGAGGGAGGGGISDILAQLQGKLGGAGGTGTGTGTGRMGEMMGDTPSFAKGAAAGGLMGALLGGRGTAKAAGAAVIGTLAWKAYQNWMAQKETQPAQAPLQHDHFVPTGAAAEQLSDKLARAMVAAAKADGKVTSLERRRIIEALTERGVGEGAKEMIEQELNSPLDVAHIAGMAATEEEAVQIYTASLLAVDPEEDAEAAYLAELASRLGLAPDLVAQLHRTTEG